MRLQNLNTRNKLLLSSLIIIGITLLIYFLSTKQEMRMSPLGQPTNLPNHPIYSQYIYTQNDTTINIGFQPLYLPTGIIFEVIKRDRILQNALKRLGKKIAYFPYIKGADINFFLKQKELVAGVGGDMPALSASSEFDIIIPVILQKGNVSIVSSRPMLTNDMKGKRIAYPFGSISHYFLLDQLHDAGIKDNEVTLIPMDVRFMADALHNNKIDLFSAWEPIVASALKQYPKFFMTYRRISTGYLYFSRKFAVNNPKAVNYILASVIRAFTWMKRDRRNLLLACQWNLTEMEKLTGGKDILDTEEIADLALKDILGYNSKFSIVINENDTQINSPLHQEFRFLKGLNKVPASSRWDKVSKSFDRNLILKIFKQPKKYNLNKFDYDTAFKEY